MNNFQSKIVNEKLDNNSFSLEKELKYYLSYWKWFILSVIICFVLGTLYIRYSTPIYKASIKIIVKDDKKGGILSELDVFTDMQTLGKVKSNVDNEIEILKSRKLSVQTVKNLNLNVQYFVEGRIKKIELYDKSPIKVDFSEMPVEFFNNYNNFFIRTTSNKTFDLFSSKETKIGSYYFDIPFDLYNGKACVSFIKEYYLDNESNQISIVISPTVAVGNNFLARLNINTLSKNTSVLELSVTDPVPNRAQDFLDELVNVYIEDAISDKKYVAENTSEFIKDRLSKILNELGGAEKNTESYKISHKITNLQGESELFLANATEFEKKEIEIETQLKVVETMSDYLAKASPSDLIPSNILTSDANASGLIDNYNQLILNRNKLLKNAGPQNPKILGIEANIASLKENIMATLQRLKSSLKIQRDDFRMQNDKMIGKISNSPTIEKEMRGLGRQQHIKETLYLYLLEKREENAISLAVTEPNAKIIDKALASLSPVAPKASIIKSISFLLGILIPFSILFLIQLFDNKIKFLEDVKSKLDIPFLGDVPTSLSSDDIISFDSRTSSAEAIRFIRTNLEFLLINSSKVLAKTIFVTSTISKEGKTFVGVNLAGSIALSNKKVLLLDLDIRNSKLNNYISTPSLGVTQYLYKDGISLDDVIFKVPGFESFYVLPCGISPPNPAELLMSSKLEKMFEDLKKQYDYIVVDTAPVGLVTDTLIIAKHADVFAYVIRYNYLNKQLLNIPSQLYKDKKLPNMSFILNDTSSDKGYGYGYGYGYGNDLDMNKMTSNSKTQAIKNFILRFFRNK